MLLKIGLFCLFICKILNSEIDMSKKTMNQILYNNVIVLSPLLSHSKKIKEMKKILNKLSPLHSTEKSF